jgi:hypothetical protein
MECALVERGSIDAPRASRLLLPSAAGRQAVG